MNSADLLGLSAAILATIAMAPQVIKVGKTKSTSDLSLSSFTLLSTSLFLWFIYGVIVSSYPIIIGNFVGFAMNIYIVFMKIRHG